MCKDFVILPRGIKTLRLLQKWQAIYWQLIQVSIQQTWSDWAHRAALCDEPQGIVHTISGDRFYISMFKICYLQDRIHSPD